MENETGELAGSAEDNKLETTLPFVLSGVAARALGSLIEKEFVTPDVYPLTLNALTNACNQRNNREPVMALSEAEVAAGLEELRAAKLAVVFAGADSRVPKYKHKLEQEYAADGVVRALLCELLLRGPQTTAALRANSERLHRQPNVVEVEAILDDLAKRKGGALVLKLPRQIGQKEARWSQLFAGTPASRGEEDVVVRPVPSDLERRVEALEGTLARLAADLADLRAELGVSRC